MAPQLIFFSCPELGKRSSIVSSMDVEKVRLEAQKAQVFFFKERSDWYVLTRRSTMLVVIAYLTLHLECFRKYVVVLTQEIITASYLSKNEDI